MEEKMSPGMQEYHRRMQKAIRAMRARNWPEVQKWCTLAGRPHVFRAAYKIAKEKGEL